MTGEDNTKVCNNKTLLGTCMLMSIVCMLSGSDVLGMEEKEEDDDPEIVIQADYLIQQLENKHETYENFKGILGRTDNFIITKCKYKKRCYCCCDTDKIDFKETTIFNKNWDDGNSKSLADYMTNRFYYQKNTNDISLRVGLLETDLDNFIIKNIKAPK